MAGHKAVYQSPGGKRRQQQCSCGATRTIYAKTGKPVKGPAGEWGSHYGGAFVGKKHNRSNQPKNPTHTRKAPKKKANRRPATARHSNPTAAFRRKLAEMKPGKWYDTKVSGVRMKVK